MIKVFSISLPFRMYFSERNPVMGSADNIISIRSLFDKIEIASFNELIMVASLVVSRAIKES
jgi:hypothetical protein